MICPNDDCPDVRITGKRGAYRDGIRHCPRCGFALVPAVDSDDEIPAPEPPARWEFETFEPIVVLRKATLVPLVRSLMTAAGIRHMVRDEGTLEVHGYPRFFPGRDLFGVPTLYVEPERADEARGLLDGIDGLAAAGGGC